MKAKKESEKKHRKSAYQPDFRCLSSNLRKDGYDAQLAYLGLVKC